MAATDSTDVEALVASVWGQAALAEPPDADPEVREMLNQALSVAIRMYLQSYLDDVGSTLRYAEYDS